MEFTIRVATPADVSKIAQLERLHANDELQQSTGSLQGQTFSESQLLQLINKHWLVVAEQINEHSLEKEQQIVGYVVAAAWSFFDGQNIYRHILKQVSRLDTPKITVNNSCQYGPIWVAPSVRGNGIFEALVTHLKGLVRSKFPYMVTFIAEDNGRSYAAHTRKGGMQVVDFFSFEQRDFYLLLASC